MPASVVPCTDVSCRQDGEHVHPSAVQPAILELCHCTLVMLGAPNGNRQAHRCGLPLPCLPPIQCKTPRPHANCCDRACSLGGCLPCKLWCCIPLGCLLDTGAVPLRSHHGTSSNPIFAQHKPLATATLWQPAGCVTTFALLESTPRSGRVMSRGVPLFGASSPHLRPSTERCARQARNF